MIHQVIALVSLSPDHLTLSGTVLDALAGLPAIAPESFNAPAILPLLTLHR
jgi:hypothetical protein